MMIPTKQLIRIFVYCLTFTFVATFPAHASDKKSTAEIALIDTNYGMIKVELFAKKAPVTVKNFIQYASDKFYDNTIFHRVIPNFMIQGGGFDQEMARKQTKTPIINEAKPFVPNSRGTIAMARTNDPNSATSQFFINVVNNQFLNKTTSNPGYAVFGKVIEGMPIADKIANVKTGIKHGMRDVPQKPVIIKSIRIQPTK